MSTSNSQSPPSIDTGAHQPSSSLASTGTAHPKGKHQTRPHPPRLQHSPSLPNLWLPPHSGPIPERFIDAPRDNLHQPSTPPSLMTHFPLPDSIPAPSLSPQQNDRQLPDTQKAQARNFVNNYNKTTSTKATSTKGSPPHSKSWSQSQTQKIQKRHRVERNRPHLLLTPPLTPSSSIRTTASVESGVSTSAIGSICENEDTHEVQDTSDEVQGDDSGMDSTRFFLLGNVSRHTPSATLQTAFVSALTSVNLDASHSIVNTSSPNSALSGLSPSVNTDQLPIRHQNNLTVPNSNPNHTHTLAHGNENPIKGMYVSLQKSHGIVILAFYDVRDATRAWKTLLHSRGALAECVGNELKADGERGRFTCRFLTVGDVIKLTGSNSAFLSTADGGFFLAVEGKSNGISADWNGVRVVDDGNSDEEYAAKDGTEETDTLADSGWSGKREVNPNMLKSVLSSFGGVRTFVFANKNKEDDQVFHVEYFDVRDTDAAYNALDGQVIFGMKLRVFGRHAHAEDPPDPKQMERGYELVDHHSTPLKTPTTAPQNCIPFPSSHASETSPNEITSQFGHAGQQSQTRERFSPNDAAGRLRPRSVSAGHENYVPFSGSLSPLTPSNSSHAHVASPTYFYTLPPSSASAITPADSQMHDIHGRHNSNHLFFDAVGKAHGTEISQQMDLDSERPRSLSFDVVEVSGREGWDGRLHQWEGDMSTNQDVSAPDSHAYSSHHDCDYCPSRGSRSGPPIGHSYYNALPPSSSYYPPSRPSQYAPPPMFFPLPPSPVGFGYNFDPQAQTINTAMNMNMNNWAFEQAMMVATTNVGLNAGTGTSLGAGPSVAHGGEYWLPNAQGIATLGSQASYYPQHQQQMGHQHLYSTLPNKAQPHIQHDACLQAGHLYMPNLRSLSPPSPSDLPLNLTPNTTLAVTSIREPVVPPERNQLNLARIEDGQDTRTTVMIKNIPNKMSDQDLVAYIGKVCPRKIDFLYLRMDFQNGCNVGYAFVNFIHVQDLLSFAKKRLGEKWNLFSSEKVLQMSYANYQGKEALVEKFKNSCIMDEREAWRPKIFYSDPGPEQGLPEPFPAPTHLRRKERSSYNRGALFVPGVGNGAEVPSNSQVARRQQHGDQRSHRHYPERQRDRARESDSRSLMYPPGPSDGTGALQPVTFIVKKVHRTTR